MSTTVADVTETKVDFISADAIKGLITSFGEQSNIIKGYVNTLRAVLKDLERNSKELEKFRNKKNRTKTERSPNALPSGITKPVPISDELAKFLGVAIGTLVPRNEVTKGISGYVKSNNLSDPTNKQKFILDDRPAAKTLRALFGNPKEDVTYFNLQRYLKHHYILSDKPAAEPKKTKTEPPAPVVVETPAPVKVVKKVLVKKKPATELSEDA